MPKAKHKSLHVKVTTSEWNRLAKTAGGGTGGSRKAAKGKKKKKGSKKTGARKVPKGMKAGVAHARKIGGSYYYKTKAFGRTVLRKTTKTAKKKAAKK